MPGAVPSGRRISKRYTGSVAVSANSKAELAARQRLARAFKRTYSNASARGNIGGSPFATPAGQRSVSERVFEMI